ncbi:hypothetical protein LSM04_007524 [Trypanosoma melophagium]|uniref:uncharacterized protein n=1 Tax=Trypanosoma melophagium TaxID=715481 RepID=UPI00351AAB52|nr:hypothetical protein LSM04_007524 [Trypanosoma melophagium]
MEAQKVKTEARNLNSYSSFCGPAPLGKRRNRNDHLHMLEPLARHPLLQSQSLDFHHARETHHPLREGKRCMTMGPWRERFRRCTLRIQNSNSQTECKAEATPRSRNSAYDQGTLRGIGALCRHKALQNSPPPRK